MVTEEGLGELTALLDRYRTQLHGLPGVVGTGIGLKDSLGRADQLIIQVFIRGSDYLEDVESKAVVILGVPVEVIVSGDVTPAGQNNRRER
jgi:hypothetical protein